MALVGEWLREFWGKLLPMRCLDSGVLLQSCLTKCSMKLPTRGCHMLLTPRCHRNELYALQEPEVRRTPEPGKGTFSFSIFFFFFPEPSTTEPHIVPSGKGEILTELSSIITGQAVDLRFYKLITGTLSKSSGMELLSHLLLLCV